MTFDAAPAYLKLCCAFSFVVQGTLRGIYAFSTSCKNTKCHQGQDLQIHVVHLSLEIPWEPSDHHHHAYHLLAQHFLQLKNGIGLSHFSLERERDLDLLLCFRSFSLDFLQGKHAVQINYSDFSALIKNELNIMQCTSRSQ